MKHLRTCAAILSLGIVGCVDVQSQQQSGEKQLTLGDLLKPDSGLVLTTTRVKREDTSSQYGRTRTIETTLTQKTNTTRHSSALKCVYARLPSTTDSLATDSSWTPIDSTRTHTNADSLYQHPEGDAAIEGLSCGAFQQDTTLHWHYTKWAYEEIVRTHSYKRIGRLDTTRVN